MILEGAVFCLISKLPLNFNVRPLYFLYEFLMSLRSLDDTLSIINKLFSGFKVF